jgi:hypothetical protein
LERGGLVVLWLVVQSNNKIMNADKDGLLLHSIRYSGQEQQQQQQKTLKRRQTSWGSVLLETSLPCDWAAGP